MQLICHLLEICVVKYRAGGFDGKKRKVTEYQNMMKTAGGGDDYDPRSGSRSICTSGGDTTDTAMTTVMDVLCLNWVHPMLLILIPIPTHVHMRMDVMNLLIPFGGRRGI